MARAPKDSNRKSASFVASSTDGRTPVLLYVNPVTKRLVGTFLGSTTATAPQQAPRNDNGDTCLICESSAGDGSIVIPFANPTTHELFTQRP